MHTKCTFGTSLLLITNIFVIFVLGVCVNVSVDAIARVSVRFSVRVCVWDCVSVGASIIVSGCVCT